MYYLYNQITREELRMKNEANVRQGGIIMSSRKSFLWCGYALFLVIGGCAPIQTWPPVDRTSVKPASAVA